MSHAEGLQILSAIIRNFVIMASWGPGFMHPWSDVIAIVTARQ